MSFRTRHLRKNQYLHWENIGIFPVIQFINQVFPTLFYEVGRLFTSVNVAIRNTNKKTMKTIDKLEIILQKMEEQNNRLERIYGKHLKLIVCTGKRSEKVKFKHED